MRALVTGGAGFIGSELVHQLAAAGHDVTVIDDLSTGTHQNLAGLSTARVRTVVGDVGDASLIRSLLDDVEVVFHLACVNLRRGLTDPSAVHAVNATATLNLLEEVRRSPVRRLVHVSSSEVYGSALRLPMDERHPTEPTTPYGASKLAGEAYVRAHHLTYGVPAVIVRPFNAYGPRSHHEGDSGEVLPRFVVRALAGRPLPVYGDGRQTRDFTHVADTASGIVAAGTVRGIEGATFNLGTGREISMLALARLVIETVAQGGATVTVEDGRPGDVRRLLADATAARRVLGFSPRHHLVDGIVALAADLRAAPGGAATTRHRRSTCGMIPLFRPELGDEEIEAARRVLGSGWLAQGPEVDAFEQEFAAFVGAPFAVAVSSGSAAPALGPAGGGGRTGI